MTISPSSTQRAGSCARKRLDQLGKIAVQRFFVAALDQDLVAIAEDQGAKAVPFRFEDPVSPAGNSSTRLASIGRTGGFTGSCTPPCYRLPGAMFSYVEFAGIDHGIGTANPKRVILGIRCQ